MAENVELRADAYVSVHEGWSKYGYPWSGVLTARDAGTDGRVVITATNSVSDEPIIVNLKIVDLLTWVVTVDKVFGDG